MQATSGDFHGEETTPRRHTSRQFRLGLGRTGGWANLGVPRRRGVQGRVPRSDRYDPEPSALCRRETRAEPQPVEPRLLGGQRKHFAESEKARSQATRAGADRPVGRGGRELRAGCDGTTGPGVQRACCGEKGHHPVFDARGGFVGTAEERAHLRPEPDLSHGSGQSGWIQGGRANPGRKRVLRSVRWDLRGLRDPGRAPAS